jgi:DNA-binding transcriptional LysR family regulator
VELRQLRYFVAVAEELHFGRAAERLHIVQPAVSQQVRRLERELGLDLFDRTTRTVTLTGAGQAFLPHARAVLRAEQSALSAMAALRTHQDAALRLGTSVGLGTRLDAVLTLLAERAPQLVVELVSAPVTTRLRRVRDGDLDAAFVRGVPHSPGLELVPVWTEVLVAALPAKHPLADLPAVPLAALASLPLRISPQQANPVLVDTVIAACRAAGFEPILGPAFTTDQDTLAAIAAGAPSWTVYYAAQAEIQPGPRIVFRPFTDPAPTIQTYLATRPDLPSGRLGTLLKVCAHLAGAERAGDVAVRAATGQAPLW